MRRRSLLLATCVAFPLALGALAQAEGERQFDAAVARLRAGLGPEGAVEWRDRRIDPVSGAARLSGVTVRRGAERLTAEEVTLEGLRADRLGRALLSGLRFEGPGAAGSGAAGSGAAGSGAGQGAVTASAGRVLFAGLVLPARGGGAAVDWAGVAAEEAVVEGLRVQVAGRGEAELGRASLAGLAPGAVREAVLEGFGFLDRSDGETRLRVGRARLAGAAIPRPGQAVDPWALAADSLTLEGAELSVEKDDVSIRLGRARLEGWGAGRMASLSVEGAAVGGDTPDTGPFTMEVGRAALSGVALRDVAHAFAHEVNPPQNPPGGEQLASLEGIAVTSGGTPLVRVGSVRARNAWDPAAPGVHQGGVHQGGTEVGTLAVEGVAVDLPAEYGGAWLDGLGFKALAARMAVATRFGHDDGRLLTDPFTLQATGMGTLSVILDLRGVEVPAPGTPAPPKDDPFALMSGWTVAAYTMRYTDEGLLRALLARQAAQERVPERQLRERYAAMALRTPLPGLAPGKEPPGVRPLREAWAAFARDLGTIEMSVRPPKPVPVMEVMGLAGIPPDRMVRELGITARATPPAR